MLTTFRRMYSLLDAHDRLRFLIVLIVLILVAIAEVAGVASIMPFMAVVTNPGVIHTQPLLSTSYDTLGFQSERSFLIFLGLVVLAMLLVGNAIKATSTFLTLRYHNHLNYTLSRRLLARYMARPYEYFLLRNTSQLGANVLMEVTKVITGVLNPATLIVSSSLVCLALVVLLVIVDPVVALAIAGVLLLAYGLILVSAKRRLRVLGKRQVVDNQERFRVAAEAMSGIKDLKVLGREATLVERFAIHAEQHARSNVSVGLIAQLPRFALETIAFGGILLVVIYLVNRGADTTSIAPLLALYAFAGYRLMPALQQLFASITSVRFNSPSLEILYEDLGGDRHREEDAQDRLRSVADAPMMPFSRQLRFRDVGFQYAQAPSPAIRNFDLTISPLSTVGLVGPTGCGKTTTVDILLGLLAPTHGSLLVDDVEITPQNVASWQKNLGYVPQRIYISDDTVTRNIALGVPDAEIDLEAVRRAARLARIADFVETELADGYDTRIGEHGLRLSGGQRQRIGIARALYRDPAVLVLDEATSALDGLTEESVMEALRTLTRQKTIVVIAHRLSTVRDCDVIHVLDKGSIAASGTYSELISNSSWFRAAASE